MESIIKLYTEYSGQEPSLCERIAGGGSNREYYRITEASGHTLIGSIGTSNEENNSFIYLSRHFTEKGLPVPRILAVSEDRMAYLLSDLGNVALYDLYLQSIKSEKREEVEELLCRTMASLPKVQFEGASGLDFNKCYSVKHFDRRLVMFDLNYFKYCFLKPSGLEFNEVALQDDLERFADDLLVESDVPTFLYRDFNSRNVMVSEGEPYFIDFQGVVAAPSTTTLRRSLGRRVQNIRQRLWIG
jgi:aminoglycoside/choline kinase family phosphotransferase